jgi:hypothetical protein
MCFMKSNVMAGRTASNCCDSGLPCTLAPTLAPTLPPVTNVLSDCYTADWASSFNNEGWSACNAGYVMTKLRFNDLSGNSAPDLGNIEQVQCCRLPLATPAWPIQTPNEPNWWSWGTNSWALCPTNEFIAGLNVL